MKPKNTGTKPKRYPSDLTRTQWKRLKCLLPPAKPGGRPREQAEGQTHPGRKNLNARE